MSEYEQAVFISYAWGGDREDIVNEIEETLQLRGIRIVRDKRALGYRGSIREFMERIGQGSCIIVVISDKYLRSPNCMFELVEIAENKQFHDRIFPIVLSDANIYDPIHRIEYVKHWEAKRKELAKAMKRVDPANLQGIRDDMDQYDRIRDKISGITSILKDMNTLTPEMHRDSEFSNLYDAIVKRLNESIGGSQGESDRLTKKAEPTMPKEAAVERPLSPAAGLAPVATGVMDLQSLPQPTGWKSAFPRLEKRFVTGFLGVTLGVVFVAGAGRLIFNGGSILGSTPTATETPTLASTSTLAFTATVTPTSTVSPTATFTETPTPTLTPTPTRTLAPLFTAKPTKKRNNPSSTDLPG